MTNHAEPRQHPGPDLGRLDRAYRPALMAYFLRRLRDHAEAEDMTQEVFARLATVNPAVVQSPAAFIFSVAANLLRDRHRKRQVRLDYWNAVAPEHSARVDELDPARIMCGQESLAAFQSALTDLPHQTRRIFILHRIENISRRELAAAYRISEAAVDRHLAKAMAMLISRVREADR